VAESHSDKAKKRADRPRARHEWLENIGLIVIVILILAITITRYWHNIHWSAR
jgi:hypothetical protein